MHQPHTDTRQFARSYASASCKGRFQILQIVRAPYVHIFICDYFCECIPIKLNFVCRTTFKSLLVMRQLWKPLYSIKDSTKSQIALKLNLKSYPESVCLLILLVGLAPLATSVILVWEYVGLQTNCTVCMIPYHLISSAHIPISCATLNYNRYFTKR